MLLLNMPMVYLSEHASLKLDEYIVQVAKLTGIVIDRSQAVLSILNPTKLLDSNGNIVPDNAILISKSDYFREVKL
jgi:hypothetical protein